jgi:hypothetical protein
LSPDEFDEASNGVARPSTSAQTLCHDGALLRVEQAAASAVRPVRLVFSQGSNPRRRAGAGHGKTRVIISQGH